MQDIPTITWAEFARWLLRRRRRVRVTGDSMLPTLRPGDELLVNPRAYRRHPIQVGDVVVVRHPFRSDVTAVKRVAAVRDDGRCDLRGDNPAASEDSRNYGALAPSHIMGRVTCRFA
jgi:nickel-type superoxide dismutase maturation protease